MIPNNIRIRIRPKTQYSLTSDLESLSAAVAWLVRTIALLVVGVLVLVQIPPSVHARTTILFCGTNETVANLPRQNGVNETCIGWDCFQICQIVRLSDLLLGNCSLTHKLRICDDGDLTFIVGISLIVVLCQVLAVLSFIKLSALADYENSGRRRKNPGSDSAPSFTGR